MTDPSSSAPRIRRHGRDVLLWAVVSLPVVWAKGTSADGRFGWWEFAAGLVFAGLAVALRRRYPLAAMLGGLVLWEAGFLARHAHPEVGMAAFLPVAVALSYSAGVRMSEVRPVLGWLAGAALAVSVLVLGTTGDAGTWFVAAAAIPVLGAVPWFAGGARRRYLEFVHAGWERAEQLERAQRMIAEQARLRERARIAGDMHDLLGHELSLIALRVGGLELASDLDARHRAVAAEARAAVSAAAGRLREVVEVLRDEDAAPDPVPQDVPELVARAADSGMAVRLRQDDDAEPPAMIERAVRRVVQESLTNAAKHAPGAAITVHVGHTGDESRVSVRSAAPAGHGSGQGLVALAERVRLAGGEFQAGERDGGFEVSARLPHTGGASPEPVRSESAVRRAGARRRVRSSRRISLAVAVVSVGGVAAVLGGFEVYDAATSVLEPADFRRIQPGARHAEIARFLPEHTRIEQPPPSEPPRPAGSVCRYYGTHHNPFDERNGELHRLCFAGEVLVRKDFLPDES